MSEEDHKAVGGVRGGNQEDLGEEAHAALLGSMGLSTKIEISIECRGLQDKDLGVRDKSDPMVVVYLMRNGSWEEIGRTEIICNNLSPVFMKTISLYYNFEEIQQIGFKVYDVDDIGEGFRNDKPELIKLERQDYLGECGCTVAEIMGGSGQAMTMELTDRGQSLNGRGGHMIVRGEELSDQNALVRMRVRGENLDKLDLFGLSDPFLKFFRVREDYAGLQKMPCFKTEVRRQTLNPVWSPIELGVQQLCGGDFYRPIAIDFYDWDSDGTHDFGGSLTVTLDYLLNATTPEGKSRGENRLMLVNEAKKRSKASYQNSGFLIFEEVTIVPRPSFLDFIAGGCELNFMVAIDLTASNGPCTLPSSLHYLDPTGRQLNQYQASILACSEVLEFYDTDKRFPVWGFGGKAPGGVVNHCFSLNGNDADPEVHGVSGIMEVYANALGAIQLAGPTIFTNIIDTAAAIASSSESLPGQHYYVLLIITDGVINDMDSTISAIIRAARLPLSILIVGVGPADFSAMEVLDGDEVRLHNATGKAERDIVQFVALRDFMSSDGYVDRTNVSKALLEEIPGQLLSYMQSKNKEPMPRRQTQNPMQQQQQQQEAPGYYDEEHKQGGMMVAPSTRFINSHPSQAFNMAPPPPHQNDQLPSYNDQYAF